MAIALGWLAIFFPIALQTSSASGAATAPAPTIELWDPSAAAGGTELDFSIADALRQWRNTPVSFQSAPELKPLAERIAEIARRQLTEQDGTVPFRVVILEDFSPSAYLGTVFEDPRARPPLHPQVQVLQISIGLLRLLRNEDELAFVIGHELEHPHAEVSLRDPGLDRNMDHFFEQTQRERAEEIEVDAKSIFKRMKRSGHNPRHGPEALKRLSEYFREQNARSWGISHPEIQARIDAAEAAVTASDRLGKEVLPPLAVSQSGVIDLVRHGTVGTADYRDRYLDARLDREIQEISETVKRLVTGCLKGENCPDLAAYHRSILKELEIEEGARRLAAGCFKKPGDDDYFVSYWEHPDFRALRERLRSLTYQVFDQARSAVLQGQEPARVPAPMRAMLYGWRRYIEGSSGVIPVTPDLQAVQPDWAHEAIELLASQDPKNQARGRALFTLLPPSVQKQHAREVVAKTAENVMRSLETAAPDQLRAAISKSGWSSLLNQVGSQWSEDPDWTARTFARLQRRFFGVVSRLPIDERAEGGELALYAGTIRPEDFPVRPDQAFHWNGSALYLSDSLAKALDAADPDFIRMAYHDSVIRLLGATRSGDYPAAVALSQLHFLVNTAESRGQVKPRSRAYTQLIATALKAAYSDHPTLSKLSLHQALAYLALQDPRVLEIAPPALKPKQRDYFQVFKRIPNLFVPIDAVIAAVGGPFSPEQARDFVEAIDHLGFFSSRYEKTGPVGLALSQEWKPDLHARLALARAIQMDPELLETPDGIRLTYRIFRESTGPLRPPELAHAYHDFLGSRFKRALASAGARPDAPQGISLTQYARAFTDLNQEMVDAGVESFDFGTAQAFQAWFPGPLPERVRFVRALLQAFPEQSVMRFSLRQAFAEQTHALLHDEELLNLPSRDLTELIHDLLAAQVKSSRVDELFDAAWRRTENDAALRARLADPKLVQGLHYLESQTRLARWQLDHAFRVSARPRNPDWPRIARFVEDQFPAPGGAREQILDHVEERLRASPAILDSLQPLHFTRETARKTHDVLIVDVPHLITTYGIEKPTDKLEVLEYLLGRRQEIPALLQAIDNATRRTNALALLEQAKTHLPEYSRLARAWAILPLLDESTGILGEAALRERLLRQLVGPVLDREPVVRDLVEAYLAALEPDYRKKQYFAYVASALLEKSGTSGGKQVSVRAVLEGMGPLGIKAGQFLASSGAVSPELRAELKEFFDHAIAPSRFAYVNGNDLFIGLREVFSQDLGPIREVRELLGSGSLNYVVLADVQTPDGRRRPVTVRMQRKTAPSEIRDENDIWLRALQNLRDNSNAGPETRRLTSVLTEAHTVAMQTLHEGGQEMNLAHERDVQPGARRAYDRPARETRSGFSVGVAEVDRELQTRVPPELRQKVSVYRYVPNTPWTEVRDPKLASRLRQDVIASELRALFEMGAFDPDVHPGNWLVDLTNRRLVRIDYAQLTHIGAPEREALRESLGALLFRGWEPAPRLPHRVLELFSADERLDPRWLREIEQDPRFPSSQHIEEALFFIRDELESRLTAKKPGARVAFKDPVRKALVAISKLAVHAEDLPPLTFARILGQFLDPPPARYLATVAQGSLRAKTLTGFGCRARLKERFFGTTSSRR